MLFYLLKYFLLDVKILDHDLDDPIDALDLRHIVVEVACRDPRSKVFAHQRSRVRFHGALERTINDTILYSFIVELKSFLLFFFRAFSGRCRGA